MSKTFEALKALNQYRESHTPSYGGPSKIAHFASAHSPVFAKNHSLGHNSGGFAEGPKSFIGQAVFQNIMLVVVAVVVVSSLLLNIKALREMHSAQNFSEILNKQIAMHKKELDILAKAIYELQSKQASKIGMLETEIAELSKLLKKNDTKISELSLAEHNINTSISDLKWTTQNLTNKYIDVSAQLTNLTKTP